MTCRCCFRLITATAVVAGWALASTAAEPSFYSRREYGDNQGCASTVDFAVGDINNDGIPDIVCSGGQFLFGKGDGTFALSAEYNNLGGRGLALADINGDGNLDLINMNNATSWGFKVAFGNGDGTFGIPSFYNISDEESTYIAIGDFNGDGILDAVTVADQGVWLMTGKGGGLFNEPVLAVPGVGNPTYRFGAADMNNDGKLDLVVSIQSGISVLFGNGDGTFQPPVTYQTPIRGANVTIADINSDGYLDVLSTSTSNVNVVAIFLGGPNGTLQAPYYLDLPNYEDVEVGDVNGDGIPDLVSDSVYVAYGKGNGEFTKPVYFPVGGAATYNATSVVLAHLRNDKLLDIITNDVFVHVSVLLNNGKGAYIEGIETAIPAGLNCATPLDFNHDGIQDLGFIENGTSFTVLYGTGKSGAPFATGPSTPIPQQSGYSVGCPSTIGDINGDGAPDMLIPEINSAGTATVIYPFFGTGGGRFKVGNPISLTGNYTWLDLVDVNGDGKADMITPATNQVFYGNGNGTFQSPVTFASGVANPISDVAWADLNGDGKLDFVVQVEDGIETIFLLSNSSGGLTQTSMSDCSGPNTCYDTFEVALGDINGDGYPDLLLGSELSNMGLYLNDGKGNFTFAEELTLGGLSSASAPAILDLNGDGKPDIAVSDGGDIGVLTNAGNLEFRQAEYFGQTSGAYYFGNWHGQSATAGLPDIMMPTNTGTTTMLLNETK